MTVPPALAALVPLKAAVSLTAVPAGTLTVVPDWPPPEREVLRLVDAATAVTVSTSLPQVLTEGALFEFVSPE